MSGLSTLPYFPAVSFKKKKGFNSNIFVHLATSPKRSRCRSNTRSNAHTAQYMSLWPLCLNVKAAGLFNQHPFGLCCLSLPLAQCTAFFGSLFWSSIAIATSPRKFFFFFFPWDPGHRTADKRGDGFWEERPTVCSYCACQRLGWAVLGGRNREHVEIESVCVWWCQPKPAEVFSHLFCSVFCIKSLSLDIYLEKKDMNTLHKPTPRVQYIYPSNHPRC